MEAASYRAARDRWTGYGEAPQTPLQRYISRRKRAENIGKLLIGNSSERMRSSKLRAEPRRESRDRGHD